MPDYGLVVRRPVLDTLLLRHAGAAGAEVRESAEVVAPLQDATGRVTGVKLKGGETISADAVIAADGSYSPSSGH